MNKFRIGGIVECTFLAVLFSLTYTFLAVLFGFPLIKSEVSEVFTTVLLGIPLSFVGLSILEIFWFERDLTWSGRKQKQNSEEKI